MDCLLFCAHPQCTYPWPRDNMSQLDNHVGEQGLGLDRGFVTQNDTPGLVVQTSVYGHKDAIATIKSLCVFSAQILYSTLFIHRSR